MPSGSVAGVVACGSVRVPGFGISLVCPLTLQRFGGSLLADLLPQALSRKTLSSNTFTVRLNALWSSDPSG